MNSKLVTPPDIADTLTKSILIETPDAMVLDLILSTVNTFETDFNIYLSKDDTDEKWKDIVTGFASRVFKRPSFDEVYQCLKLLDERK